MGESENLNGRIPMEETGQFQRIIPMGEHERVKSNERTYMGEIGQFPKGNFQWEDSKGKMPVGQVQ